MKGLLISLLIMAPLYLLLCQEQAKQMDALSEASVDAAMGEVGTRSADLKALKSYQRQFEQAKGVEAMLNQGVKDRMRNIDGLDGED